MERKITNVKDLGPTQIMENYWREPVSVPHKLLKRASEDSDFRSICPVCEDGHLMMRRDPSTLKLQKNDNCTQCGTRFIYEDIEEDVVLRYKAPTKSIEEEMTEEHGGDIHIGWIIAAVLVIVTIAIIFLA